MLRLLVMFPIFLFLSIAGAKNLAVFAGGAESSPEDTELQNEFGILSRLLNKTDWETKYLYKYEAQKTRVFTRENYLKEVQSLKDRIGPGKEFSQGDQILFYISAHGSRRQRDQSSHNIDSQDGPVDLDSLMSLKQKAEENGVRLAIVDQSCFSGNLQSLKGSKTCVISGASENGFAFSNDAEKFAFRLSDSMTRKSHPNLESVFLSARISGYEPTQPMISTPAGEKAHMVLKKMASYISFMRYVPSPTMCLNTSEQSYQNLLAIEEAELRAIIPDPKLFMDLSGLLKLSFEYRKQIDMYRGPTDRFQGHIYCAKRVLKHMSLKTPEDGECLEVNDYDSPDKIDLDEKLLRKEIEEVSTQEQTESKKEDLLKFKSQLLALETMKKASEYKSDQMHLMKQKELDLEHDLYARNLSEIERTMYDKLYSYFGKSTKNLPNPCADFRF